jgi:hypothetical protein
MLRKLLCGSALAALMACPAAFSARPFARQQQNQQQQNAQAKTVSGTVTAIGNDRKSFSMDVKDESSSQPKKMQFYIDQNTQVQGRVGIGTKAMVQYEPSNDGRNLALHVTPVAGQ